MTGVGRIKAKMKIMASLGENLYKTTHVYKDWTNKEKWSRFRANEKEGIIAYQKWKEFEALKKSDDEKRRLRLEAAADLSAAGEGAVSPGTTEAGENGAAPGAAEPGTPAASASSSS